MIKSLEQLWYFHIQLFLQFYIQYKKYMQQAFFLSGVLVVILSDLKKVSLFSV